MHEIDAIYRDGAHYDRLFGRGYVEFWLAQARAAGGPILELGCGTGKLAVPLAEAGYAVTGLVRTTTVRRMAGQPDLVGSLDLRMYFPRELEALVRYNGLRIAARYGGHGGEAFDEAARFQILVCESADSTSP